MVDSRAKGNRGEADFKAVLQERDWRCFKKPRGEKGDDFTAISPDGRIFSCEVKNTVSLEYSHFKQCRDQTTEKNRLLAWHPSKWGFPSRAFIVILWGYGEEPKVQLWRGRAMRGEKS